MKTSSLSRNEGVILFISISVALLVLAILMHRFAFFGDRYGKVVAVVLSSENDVRYRSADEFLWHSSIDRLRVINEDQFFIGEGSTLKIQTIDGETLEFTENSMVVIKFQDGKVGANLLLGEAKDSKSLRPRRNVAAANPLASRVLESAHAYELKLNKPEPTPVPVKSKPKRAWVPVGQVEVQIQPVRTREALQGGINKALISWKDDLKSSLNNVATRVIIKNIQGKTLKIFRTTEDKIVWNGPRAGAYQVNVERYRRPGRALSSAGSGSNVFEIPKIKRMNAAIPLFPKPNQTILRTSEVLTLPIQISKTGDQVETQLQISKYVNFKEVSYAEFFTGTEFTLRQPLEDGIWYYRIRSLGEYTLSNWTKPVRFQVLNP